LRTINLLRLLTFLTLTLGLVVAAPAQTTYSLNGYWELTLDPQDRGLYDNWFRLPPAAIQFPDSPWHQHENILDPLTEGLSGPLDTNNQNCQNPIHFTLNLETVQPVEWNIQLLNADPPKFQLSVLVNSVLYSSRTVKAGDNLNIKIPVEVLREGTNLFTLESFGGWCEWDYIEFKIGQRTIRMGAANHSSGEFNIGHSRDSFPDNSEVWYDLEKSQHQVRYNKPQQQPPTSHRVLAYEPHSDRYVWQTGVPSFNRRRTRLKANVPSCLERYAPGYDGICWYRRRLPINIPPDGRRVFASFGAADYSATIFVNQQRVGRHDGGYTPFEFEITRYLREEKNEILVRVADLPMDNVTLDAMTFCETPHGQQWRYGNFGGLWQGVELRETGPGTLLDFYAIPAENTGEVTLGLTASLLPHRAGACRVTIIDASNPHHILVRKVLPIRPGRTDHQFNIALPGAKLWSPQAPTFYVARARLYCGTESGDLAAVRFGLKKLEASNSGFLLNGKNLTLRGVSAHNFSPEIMTQPAEPAIMARDIRLAKEAGFNLLRFDAAPPCPQFLDLCDEMGMLVWIDPPIGYLVDSPSRKARCLTEVEELIKRDRSHPSVLAWGITSLGGNMAASVGLDMVRLARQMDNSRLIISNIAGRKNTTFLLPPFSNHPQPYDGRAGCMMLRTNMTANGMADLPAVEAAYCDSAKESELEDYVQCQESLASLVEAASAYGLTGHYSNTSKMCEAMSWTAAESLREHIITSRLDPNCDGYILPQLRGYGAEWGQGLLDPWGRPEPQYTAVKGVQNNFQPILRLEKSNLAAGSAISLTGWLIDEDFLMGKESSNLSAELKISAASAVYEQSFTWNAQQSGRVTQLFDKSFEVPNIYGPINFTLTVNGPEALGETSEAGWVFHAKPQIPFMKKNASSTGEIVVVDPAGRLASLLVQLGLPCRSGFAGSASPSLVIVDRIKDLDAFAYPPELGKEIDAWVKEGGTILFLSPPWSDTHVAGVHAFPWKIKRVPTLENQFTYLLPGPLTKDLPAGFVGRMYQHLLPENAISGLPPQTVQVGSCGPYGKQWDRAYLAKLPLGKGTCYINNLRPKDLSDPLSWQLMFNLLDSILNKPGGK
jgi:Glycosyl hydrolases family 2, TIM barrel domain/Glycosyl hydrolases family 2, sugar binding domain